MADAQNESAPKAPKVKTVADDMAGRRIFATTTEAQTYLEALGESLSDFGDQTFAMVGVGQDEDGNATWDESIYTDSTDIMVAKLNNAGQTKAIVVAPVPKIQSILADEAGLKWAEKILHKELNHVAVRALRTAEDVATVIDQMPTDLSGYISSGRGDSGGIMESFNELYKQINATLAKMVTAWSRARLTKPELKKAMESKGYASEYYPALEDYKGKSLFVAAAELGAKAAERKGLDPAIFTRWLETRDAKAFTPGETDEDDLESLDLDNLTEALLADDQPADAAAE